MTPEQSIPDEERLEPPVDMARFHDLSGEDPEELRSLAGLSLEQTAAYLEQLAAAIQKRDVESVRRISHSCAGSSATCGMNGLAVLLRAIETTARQGGLEGAQERLNQAHGEFERVRRFLEPYLPQ